MQESRAERIEALLTEHVSSKRHAERAKRLREAQVAHGGLLCVFFQVESTATVTELRRINRMLSYLAKHIKAIEADIRGNPAYDVAKREVAQLYN